MKRTLTIKRLEEDVVKKLEILHNAKIDIKSFISDAIRNFNVDENNKLKTS